VGGVVLTELGRRPRVGDRVRVGPAELEVQEVLGNRIRALRLTLLATGPAEAAEAPAD
jgi:CBS domain containing-hemolysin-like protein